MNIDLCFDTATTTEAARWLLHRRLKLVSPQLPKIKSAADHCGASLPPRSEPILRRNIYRQVSDDPNTGLARNVNVNMPLLRLHDFPIG